MTGAVTVMNENDAQILWSMITQTFRVNWENIDEDVMKELGLESFEKRSRKC